MGTALTKTADMKGRISLGPQVANRLVSVTQVSDSEYVVKLVRAIPEDEAWLYENPAALASVRSGLRQARDRRLKKGPSLSADKKLTDQLEG
jgi:hypothetical protein